MNLKHLEGLVTPVVRWGHLSLSNEVAYESKEVM